MGGSEKKKEEVGEMLVRRVDNMIPHRFGGMARTMLSYNAVQCSDSSEEYEDECDCMDEKASLKRYVAASLLPEMEEEEDDDMGFGLFSDGEDENKTDFMRTKDKSEGKEGERTLHEKMMDLMTLQTASGHFAEHKMIGDIIGKPLDELKAQAPDSKPESMKSWMTAIVIAFLELRCPEEKDLWQMSVQKARAVILENVFIENAKKIIVQF